MRETRLGSPSRRESNANVLIHRPGPAPPLAGATRKRTDGTARAPHPIAPPTAAIAFMAPRRPWFVPSATARGYRGEGWGRQVPSRKGDRPPGQGERGAVRSIGVTFYEQAMRVLIGTSGYSYKEWKGPFYPKEVTASG